MSEINTNSEWEIVRESMKDGWGKNSKLSDEEKLNNLKNDILIGLNKIKVVGKIK